jgi:hypothetical protein
LRRSLALVAAVAAVAAGATLIARQDGADERQASRPELPEGANLWVATSAGGSARRCATPCAFDPAAAYGSIDAAWDAASDGDVIVVTPGAYEAQTITGDKAAPTVVRGSGDATVLADLVTKADHLHFQDLTIDTRQSGGAVGWTNTASDVVARRVRVHGAYASVYFASSAKRVHWYGGELGTPGQEPAPRHCGRDRQPLEISGAGDVIVDHVRFARQENSENGENGCPATDNYHLEIVRIENAAQGVTIRNSRFEDGQGANTSVIYVTSWGAGFPTGVLIAGNYVGDTEASTGPILIGGQDLPAGCHDVTVAYNSFRQGPGSFSGCAGFANNRWIGNAGWRQAFGPCYAAHIGGVYQDSATQACPGDVGVRWVNGTRTQIDRLGLDEHMRPQAGSPVIDAAEVPGGDDLCTASLGTEGGAGGLGGVDLDGRRRGVGAACDAGAYEFQG